MNRKLKLTLIACALGAASVTSAQTSNNTPPNDVIRLPGNVTTPTMPVVISSPRDDTGRGTAAGSVNGAGGQLPVVRSLGDSMDDTLSDGAATGASAPIDTAARKAGVAPAPESVDAATSSDSGSKSSDNAGTGAATGKDTSATSGASTEAGASSRIADTGNAATQQNTQQDRQRGDTNAAPDRFGTPPAKGAPNAPTSTGK